MKKIITAIAAAAASAALLIIPAAQQASAATAITSTFCNTPPAPWVEYQACVTVRAAGSYVYWARGTVRVQAGYGGFSGHGTLELAGFFADTGKFGAADGKTAVRAVSFNVDRTMPGSDRVSTVLRTSSGTVRASWGGPVSYFGQSKTSR